MPPKKFKPIVGVTRHLIDEKHIDRYVKELSQRLRLKSDRERIMVGDWDQIQIPNSWKIDFATREAFKKRIENHLKDVPIPIQVTIDIARDSYRSYGLTSERSEFSDWYMADPAKRQQLRKVPFQVGLFWSRQPAEVMFETDLGDRESEMDRAGDIPHLRIMCDTVKQARAAITYAGLAVVVRELVDKMTDNYDADISLGRREDTFPLTPRTTFDYKQKLYSRLRGLDDSWIGVDRIYYPQISWCMKGDKWLKQDPFDYLTAAYALSQQPDKIYSTSGVQTNTQKQLGETLLRAQKPYQFGWDGQRVRSWLQLEMATREIEFLRYRETVLNSVRYVEYKVKG